GFRGQIGARLAAVPTILYFHENQISYPWSEYDKAHQYRNNQYGILNFSSALAADQIWFNSAFHQRDFFEKLPGFLKQFPDQNQLHRIPEIKDKSAVFHLGMNLRELLALERNVATVPPLITWNHRWEYDKNPEVFFKMLFQLKDEGHAFQLAVLGEQYSKSPPIFLEAQQQLVDHIVHWGYADRASYHRWLQQTDFLPVTSQQDFFGGSLVEAMAAGAIPLVPNRLAFPEHIPSQHRHLLVYDSDKKLLRQMRSFLQRGVPTEVRSDLRNLVSRYDWSTLAPIYDQGFEALLQANK
ncbi:MAG: DUF3524 domain-containing protein, partial [Bacteroidota bacterium]